MLRDETKIPFSVAARTLPPCRAGRPVHISTLHRWATHGVRGVRLETARVGVAHVTSREALQRFFEAIQRGGASAPQPAPQIDDARAKRAQEALAAELAPRRKRIVRHGRTVETAMLTPNVETR